MRLTLKERLLIPGICPTKGSFEDLVVREDLIKKLEVTQEEIVKYEIKSREEGGLGWNKEGLEATFEIDLTELESGIVKKALVAADDKRELGADFVSLYRKFVS